MKRRFVRVAFVLAVSVLSTALASGTAMATELGEYVWKRRPLLVFAPSAGDPRVVETSSRIEASRCDFVDRDMVLGVVVAEGTSTLDGRDIDPDEAQRLTRQYAVGANVFTVVLIGKDGGEKLRVNDVPDLQRIYDLIDGMPMRGSEMRAGPRRC